MLRWKIQIDQLYGCHAQYIDGIKPVFNLEKKIVGERSEKQFFFVLTFLC